MSGHFGLDSSVWNTYDLEDGVSETLDWEVIDLSKLRLYMNMLAEALKERGQDAYGCPFPSFPGLQDGPIPDKGTSHSGLDSCSDPRGACAMHNTITTLFYMGEACTDPTPKCCGNWIDPSVDSAETFTLAPVTLTSIYDAFDILDRNGYLPDGHIRHLFPSCEAVPNYLGEIKIYSTVIPKGATFINCPEDEEARNEAIRKWLRQSQLLISLCSVVNGGRISINGADPDEALVSGRCRSGEGNTVHAQVCYDIPDFGPPFRCLPGGCPGEGVGDCGEITWSEWSECNGGQDPTTTKLTELLCLSPPIFCACTMIGAGCVLTEYIPGTLGEDNELHFVTWLDGYNGYREAGIVGGTVYWGLAHVRKRYQREFLEDEWTDWALIETNCEMLSGSNGSPVAHLQELTTVDEEWLAWDDTTTEGGTWKRQQYVTVTIQYAPLAVTRGYRFVGDTTLFPVPPEQTTTCDGG